MIFLMTKIGFLGCGNMGEAFLKKLLEKRVFQNSEILVVEKYAEKLKTLEKKYQVETSTNIHDLENMDLIFLAIKPQTLPEINLQPKKKAIILSILAGTNTEKLKSKFPENKVVRSMPNLGQFVDRGMTGVFFDPEGNFLPEEKNLIRKIFQSGGKIVEIEDENFMDKITAISGSGPAYFFLFVEKLIESAVNLGFTEKEAKLLVQETFFSAAEILKNNPDDSAAQWRKRVTSKGGTTEAALKIFQDSDFSQILSKATKAAEERAKELGK